ncbi:MAG: peptide-methionine (R)-S-oxide reductase [Marinilabiliales bacterium]|nr:peptide-methionine (R)-S-oxide reductase [Marinilabiliales bacterium]
MGRDVPQRRGHDGRVVTDTEDVARRLARRVAAERYAVLFEEATEPAGTSPLNREKRAGTYLCAACNQPLFGPRPSSRAAPAGPASRRRWRVPWTPSGISTVLAAHGVPLLPHAAATRARLRRRPGAHRPALVQQRSGPDVRAGGGTSAAARGVTARRVVPPQMSARLGLDSAGPGPAAMRGRITLRVGGQRRASRGGSGWSIGRWVARG